MNEKPCTNLETSVPGRNNVKGNGSAKGNEGVLLQHWKDEPMWLEQSEQRGQCQEMRNQGL